MLARCADVAALAWVRRGVAAVLLCLAAMSLAAATFGAPPSGVPALTTGTPEPDHWLMNGAPTELALAPLASFRLEEESVPLFPARLTLARQHYAAQTWSGVWRALGPVLFIVEEGSVTLSHEGVLTRLAPGDSVLVQRDQFVGVINDADIPATLLRLAVAPPSSPDLAVGVAPAQIVTIIRVPEPLPTRVPPTRTWLFQSVVPWRPIGPVRLFVARAAWDPDQGGPSPLRHPGWVGLVLLEGSLRVDETATLRAGGCRLTPPRVAYRAAAGDDPPTALLFGFIPDGQDLWLPGDGAPNASPSTTATPDVVCGDGP
jgi:hypothetical protein